MTATSLDADLHAHIGVRLPAFSLDLEFTVRPGEVVALLGPNGAGKTTTLRALAGLLPLDSGRITLGGAVLDDPRTGLFVDAAQRSVGVVFQDYLLFPHLSVRENVAFGLRARGTAKHEARAAADAWLQRMGLAELGDRRPEQLSGGQQQRVALARALAFRPGLLLLDEPLAALDAATRGRLRRDLRGHLDTFDGSVVMVTHDPVDAHAVADRVVVVEAGREVQAGTLAEVAAHPRSAYVAELVGINLLAGRVDGGVFHTEHGAAVVVGSTDATPDGDAFLAIRPQSVSLHLAHPEGSQRNVWETSIEEIDHHHDRVRVRLAGALPIVAEITPAALASMHLAAGQQVWAAVKATEVSTYLR